MKSSFTSNACATVLQGTPKPETLTTKWKPSSISPTVVSFPPPTTTTSPNITITFGGPGTTGTGSYPGSNNFASATASITLGQTTTDIQNACSSAKGLKSLTIVSGHVN